MCTIYPRENYFTVLVVVGKKEKDAVKAILQEFNPILRDIYCQTKDGNGQRWLMIDLEDKETLALFAAGDTKGIFQFEAAGAINLLKRIKPSRFEEVVATTSLNRPGASDYTENFIRRKSGSIDTGKGL